MPNRRAHDHIGQIRQKLGIRIGADAVAAVISNLKSLVDSAPKITIADIDKIVNKIITDTKFRGIFIKDFRGAVKTLDFMESVKDAL
jgi:hypothetical protein